MLVDREVHGLCYWIGRCIFYAGGQGCVYFYAGG